MNVSHDKAVLESGLVRTENDHYVLDGPLPQRAIPATIHDLSLIHI